MQEFEFIRKTGRNCFAKQKMQPFSGCIFAVFAYEFEPSQFLMKSFACAHGEIIHFVNCEILLPLVAM